MVRMTTYINADMENIRTLAKVINERDALKSDVAELVGALEMLLPIAEGSEPCVGAGFDLATAVARALIARLGAKHSPDASNGGGE